MFKIEYEKIFEYIPLQYNLCIEEGVRDFRASYLYANYLQRQLQECTNIQKIYIFDMRYLTSGSEMELGNIVEYVKINNIRLILYGLSCVNFFNKAIESCCLKFPTYVQWVEEKDMCLLGRIQIQDVSQLVIQNIIQSYLQEYMERYTEKKYGYLVSSGIYSDKEINYKKMFYNSENTSYTIYLLFRKIIDEGMNCHYLVATSKNGVAIATILGEILGVEVVYLNVGQMFEERYNVMPPIKSGKKYLHVYDVICSGSETKIANTLIEINGGVIVASVGILCLLDLDAAKQNNAYSVMNKVRCLMELKNTNIEYGIFLKDKEKENGKA